MCKIYLKVIVIEFLIFFSPNTNVPSLICMNYWLLMLSAQPISGIKDWWKGARMHLIMGLAQTHQVCLYPKLQNIPSEEILVMINAFPPISFCFCPLVAQKWSFYNGLFMANNICGFPFQVNMNCKHDLKNEDTEQWLFFGQLYNQFFIFRQLFSWHFITKQ